MPNESPPCPSLSPGVLVLLLVHQVQHAQSNPWDFVRKGFSLAVVTKNGELLHPAANDRSTRFVEVDISDGPNLR